MTTFLYTTSSNTVELSDPDAVAELFEEYHPETFCVEPMFNQDAGTLAFHAVDSHSGFDVNYADQTRAAYRTRAFLEDLAPHLAETFEIKCVETQGYGEPSASKWVVEPDGSVTLHHF